MDVLPLLIEKYLAKVALPAVLDREMPKTALVKALLQSSPDLTLNAISLFFKSNLMCVR